MNKVQVMEKIEGYRFNEKFHAHTLRGLPLMGTTTLIKEVMPPMLSWYGSGMAVKTLGWFDRKEGRTNYLPEEIGMPKLEAMFKEIKQLEPSAYLNLLDHAYKAHDEHKKTRGVEGTDTHKLCELAIKEAIKSNKGYLSDKSYENKVVEKFATWGRGKRFIYSEIHVYSELLWLGGVLDCVYEHNNEYYIGDIKTSKDIYPSQIIQEGLYDCQQQENGYFDENGNKIGESLDIKGYTVINLTKKFKEGKNPCTYRGTQQMREFGPSLVQLYKIIQELKTII